MGKIRIKTLGSDRDEKMQAVLAEKRRAAKRLKKMQEDGVKDASELTGVTAQLDSAGEVSGAVSESSEAGAGADGANSDEAKKEKSKKSTNKKSKSSGKTARYLKLKASIDDKKSYNLKDAVTLVKSGANAKFDETVELHLNMSDSSAKGEVTLPHGTGKEVRVAIVNDAVIAKIDAGEFDFDVLISTPADMSRLLKYARTLGPKGLMPNPKKGTVSENPEDAAKKFKGGNVHYKTEAKAPLIHQSVGKVSFKDEAIVENVEVFLKSVGKKGLEAAYLTSTMAPSVRLNISSI